MTSPTKSVERKGCAVRSVPIVQWPAADRAAWVEVCRPAARLKRGGAASHMREVTRHDLARRYGYFLDHVHRTEGLNSNSEAGAYVTPDRVDRYLAELKLRVNSVTVHGSIYKLRRMAKLLAPGKDYKWLTEIENDLALATEPKSKADRLRYSHVLIHAGMKLMAEAEAATHRSALARARQFRNGLMLALLGFHLIRLKNFAALEIGSSFNRVNGSWWIVLTASQTKEKRADERCVDPLLAHWIERYLDIHRPVLARNGDSSAMLWLSSNDGKPMTYLGVEGVITKTTKRTVGVNISPHLFRTAGASTAAVYAGSKPYLATALLHHRDPAVNGEHYNRASSLSATQKYAALIRSLCKRD